MLAFPFFASSFLLDLVRQAALPERTSFETLRWTSALRCWRSGMAPDVLSARLGLSPITWAETAQKLGLLAAGVGPATGVSEAFPVRGEAIPGPTKPGQSIPGQSTPG